MSLYNNASNGAIIIDMHSYVRDKNNIEQAHREQETTDYSVVTTPRARAHVREGEMEDVQMSQVMRELDSLYDYYCDAYGRTRVAPAIRRDIATALSDGADLSLIIYGIDESCNAPSPSWSYAMAVVRRCIRDGCMDADAAREQAAQYRASMRKKPATFAQREVTEDEFANIYVDVMQRPRREDKKP